MTIVFVIAATAVVVLMLLVAYLRATRRQTQMAVLALEIAATATELAATMWAYKRFMSGLPNLAALVVALVLFVFFRAIIARLFLLTIA
jgi:hypothetical protein